MVGQIKDLRCVDPDGSERNIRRGHQVCTTAEPSTGRRVKVGSIALDRSRRIDSPLGYKERTPAWLGITRVHKCRDESGEVLSDVDREDYLGRRRQGFAFERSRFPVSIAESDGRLPPKF